MIFVEAFGEKIKKYKYYFCATLFIYEFIWYFSIFTYVYSLINICEMEKCLETLKNMSARTCGVLRIVHFIIIVFIYCSYWMKNTSAHISICADRIFRVSKFEIIIDCCTLYNKHFLFLLIGSTKNSKHYQMQRLNCFFHCYIVRIVLDFGVFIVLGPF